MYEFLGRFGEFYTNFNLALYIYTIFPTIYSVEISKLGFFGVVQGVLRLCLNVLIDVSWSF